MCAKTSKNGKHMLGISIGFDQTASVTIYLYCCRSPKKIFTFSELLSNLAEVMTGEFGSVDGEANILIQAIMSIKSIIQKDPPSHEKVFSVFCLAVGKYIFFCTLILLLILISKSSDKT